MQFYTEKNGLAQFWNRDMTRIEWAKWVYHHPEQTEKLIEYLLKDHEAQSLIDSLIERLDRNDAVDIHQEEEIQNLQTISETDAISIQALEELLNSL